MMVDTKARAKRRQLSKATDQELIEACLKRDEEAWAYLVEKYKNLVYSVPMKYRMGPEDAADIFQSVWLELYSHMARLRSPGALRSWLVTVAAHKSYEWKCRQSATPAESAEEMEIADSQKLPLEWKLEIERQQVLRDAIVLLPERCRTIVQLLFFEDPPLPYSQLADRLNLAEGSIGFIRGRCLKRLRSHLEQIGF